MLSLEEWRSGSLQGPIPSMQIIPFLLPGGESGGFGHTTLLTVLIT